MRKLGAIVLIGFLLAVQISGCASRTSFQDGEYRAEFEDYDSRGYKDYLDVVVEEGIVTQITFDALDQDGNRKTEDTKYQEDMEAVQGTYPAKYSADLVNQYLETQSLDEVDALAGATYSTESFMALFSALEKNMLNGDTTPIVIENISEK